MDSLKRLPDVVMTESEFKMTTWGIEYVRLCLMLNLTEAGRMISSALLVSDGPVSELGLSQSLSIPRSTVRDRVKKMVRMGMARRHMGRGVELTVEGRRFFILIARELMEISTKQRRALSPEIIDVLEEMSHMLKGSERFEIDPSLRGLGPGLGPDTAKG